MEKTYKVMYYWGEWRVHKVFNSRQEALTEIKRLEDSHTFTRYIVYKVEESDAT